MIQSHKELIVWQKAMELVVCVYNLTKDFPKDELYGLTSQMRRSAVSIPSNIAEGRKRGTSKDYRQFLLIAFGSAAELETQIELSKRLKLGNNEKCLPAEQLLQEVLRMLAKMTTTLRPSIYKIPPTS